MHNHDDKYPSRLGFEPGIPRLQAPVDTKEPSGLVTQNLRQYTGTVRRHAVTSLHGLGHPSHRATKPLINTCFL